MPGGMAVEYMDEGSYAIYKEGQTIVDINERAAYADKLNQYYYDNYAPIPIFELSVCFAWNPAKISAFPHSGGTAPVYLEYVRHEQPLNTFRLFTPWKGR